MWPVMTAAAYSGVDMRCAGVYAVQCVGALGVFVERIAPRYSVYHDSHNASVVTCLPVPVSARCTTDLNIHPCSME